MERISPKEIVSSIHEIGALPQTLAAVLKAVDDPNTGAKEIAKAISTDVSLTTLVLKMVNSAHYNRARRVSKISEAVAVMGVNSLKVLALSSSVFSLVCGQELAEKFNIKRISRHFIEVASTARSIAKIVDSGDEEEAFVGGILHDVGILIMILHFQDKYDEVLKEMSSSKKGLIEAEKKILGCTHCDVGAELIESWKLPTKLAFAVQNHHDCDKAGIIPEDSTFNNVIALADRIALGPFEDYYPEVEQNIELVHELSKKLNIKDIGLDKIRKESIVQSIKLAQYLELDVGDLIEILSDANKKLAEMYLSLEKLYIEKEELIKKNGADQPQPVEV
ncbi:MAG: HDOD domain-containing protein [candidate division Zixibacteria bacterium]|nr:HDOD domain-containing protein [candidate division Zixibacteria bacterium]